MALLKHLKAEIVAKRNQITRKKKGLFQQVVGYDDSITRVWLRFASSSTVFNRFNPQRLLVVFRTQKNGKRLG